MRSSQKRLVWYLLVAVLFLVLVAAASAAVYFWLRRQPSVSTGWQNPIAEIRPAEISPAWALWPLAGALELETIDEAVANGDLETAYATIVFSTDLSDAQRIGRLILLGRGFVEAEKPDRAALVYGQIYDLAILSPNLTDPARAEALLACGKGWAEIGQEEQALAVYGQVRLLADDSPYLQRAYRRELMSVLEVAYRDLGAAEQADAAGARIIELDRGAYLQFPAPPPETPHLPGVGEPISSAEVGVLEEARRQAAYALQQATPMEGEPPAGLIAALSEALQKEDAAKLALYAQEMEASSQLSRRINVHWHLIHWLTFKVQVAQRGLGLSLVPAWEEQVADIQSRLSTAYEDLFFDYEDLVTGEPDVALMGPGRYRVRRAVTLAGRLGQYPNYPEQRSADKVAEAARALIAAGFVDQLYVDFVADEAGLQFFFSPADAYGASAPTP